MDSNLGLSELHYKPENSSHDRLNFALSSLASINSSPISISIEIWYERENADELAPAIIVISLAVLPVKMGPSPVKRQTNGLN